MYIFVELSLEGKYFILILSLYTSIHTKMKNKLIKKKHAQKYMKFI
jgi:hypothetical protein